MYKAIGNFKSDGDMQRRDQNPVHAQKKS